MTRRLGAISATILTIGLVLVSTPPGALGQVSPSLSPGPSPTVTTPNSERPLTTDELLGLRSRLSRTGGTATVVATAAIARDIPIRRGGVCLPQMARTTGCLFGVLVTPSDSAGYVLVSATTGVAESFPDGDAPVEGDLAFVVDGGGGLRLLGAVETPSGTYRTPVDEGSMAEATGIAVGHLVAVDGWLGVLGLGIACPMMPPGKLGWQGTSSPFVRCPGGWITADPEAIVGASGFEPLGFGIPVQADAYDRYAPDPASTGSATVVPPEAVYLLRNVANPEPGIGPASGWRVVGRLDPMIGPVEASPAASPIADGCGPAVAPVLDERNTPGGHGGRWVIRDVDRVSARAARAAGLTAILPTYTAGLQLRYRALSGHLLSSYFADAPIGKHDTLVDLIREGGFFLIEVPTRGEDHAKVAKSVVGDRGTSVVVGSTTATMVFGDEWAKGVRPYGLYWTDRGSDWTLIAGLDDPAAVIDVARSLVCR